MIGQPKHKVNDVVTFKAGDKIVSGIIWVVDAFGTWDYPDDVCYDIYDEAENMIYKHIKEKDLT